MVAVVSPWPEDCERRRRLPKKNFYAVRRGHRPGIYERWFGPQGAQVQVDGFPGAVYRGFARREEAEAFLKGTPSPQRKAEKAPNGTHVVVYTDGGAIGNPGPGGYGVVIIPPGGSPEELSGGFRQTTNNRMELMACIVALDHTDGRLPILLHSDSRYLVDAINKRWAFGWRRKGWRRADGQPAKNPDLWERLLGQLETRDVTFQWVKGHAGEQWNERCDALAGEAMARDGLPADTYYEKTCGKDTED